MNTTDDAVRILEAALPRLEQECRAILAGELHY